MFTEGRGMGTSCLAEVTEVKIWMETFLLPLVLQDRLLSTVGASSEHQRG